MGQTRQLACCLIALLAVAGCQSSDDLDFTAGPQTDGRERGWWPIEIVDQSEGPHADPTGHDQTPEPPCEIIRLSADLLFAIGSSEINDNEAHYLDTVAELIKSNQVEIVIDGHTDNNGTDDFNYNLGLDRANVIERALTARGVPTSLIHGVQSLGESDPIEPNTTPQGRARNRRVEIYPATRC